MGVKTWFAHINKNSKKDYSDYWLLYVITITDYGTAQNSHSDYCNVQNSNTDYCTKLP